MKHLLLTTIAALVLVGCVSLNQDTNVEPNLELTSEGLLVDDQTQVPYTGKQSAKFDSGTKHWEGSLRDGKRHGQCTLWDMRGTKRSLIRFKDGVPHGEWIQWNLKGEMELLIRYSDGKRVQAVFPGPIGNLDQESTRWGLVVEKYKFQDKRWLKYKPSKYPFRYFQRVVENSRTLKARGGERQGFAIPPGVN